MDVLVARLERHPRTPARHVQRVRHPHDAGLDRERVPGPAVADDRVQRLRHHHRALRLAVAAFEQAAQLVGGEEQRVGLVVGAMDLHPHAVEERGGRDHHLGVAL